MRNEWIEEKGFADPGLHDVLHLFRSGKSHLPACAGTGGGRQHAARHAGIHDDGRRAAAPGNHGDRARGRRICKAPAQADIPVVRDDAARHPVSDHRAAVRHAEDGRRIVRDRHPSLPWHGRRHGAAAHLHGAFLRRVVLSVAQSEQAHRPRGQDAHARAPRRARDLVPASFRIAARRRA